MCACVCDVAMTSEPRVSVTSCAVVADVLSRSVQDSDVDDALTAAATAAAGGGGGGCGSCESGLHVDMTVCSQSSSTRPATVANRTSQSWLLRLFESKMFDMSIAIQYLFNSKEAGVQSYIGESVSCVDAADAGACRKRRSRSLMTIIHCT